MCMKEKKKPMMWLRDKQPPKAAVSSMSMKGDAMRANRASVMMAARLTWQDIPFMISWP